MTSTIFRELVFFKVVVFPESTTLKHVIVFFIGPALPWLDNQTLVYQWWYETDSLFR